MPFEKTVTIYERIPLEELVGHVSPTEIRICKVINLFIDDLCESSDDDFSDLAWDQILMRFSRTSDYLVMPALLDHIVARLHGSGPAKSGTEAWERESTRQDILRADGYIFGDWRMKPYSIDAGFLWVLAEWSAMQHEKVVAEFPDVIAKAKAKTSQDKAMAFVEGKEVAEEESAKRRSEVGKKAMQKRHKPSRIAKDNARAEYERDKSAYDSKIDFARILHRRLLNTDDRGFKAPTERTIYNAWLSGL